MGRVTVSEDRCNGCKGQDFVICVDDCPTDVLRFSTERQKAFVAYQIDCTTCFLCQNLCPTGAIDVSAEATRPPILIY